MNRLILLNKDGEIILQRGHGRIRPNEFIVDINGQSTVSTTYDKVKHGQNQSYHLFI